MPETVLLALLISKCKKYSIKPLFQKKEIYYVLAIELVYMCLQILLFSGNYEVIKYASMLKSVYLCTYLGLILKHELYKEALIGSGCMLVGGLCNQLAIGANGGKMPVFPSLSYLTGYARPGSFEAAYKVANDFHILGTDTTHLELLTDIFDIGYSILSIGDILIRIFVVLVIVGAVKKLNYVHEEIQTCL